MISWEVATSPSCFSSVVRIYFPWCMVMEDAPVKWLWNERHTLSLISCIRTPIYFKCCHVPCIWLLTYNSISNHEYVYWLNTCCMPIYSCSSASWLYNWISPSMGNSKERGFFPLAFWLSLVKPTCNQKSSNLVWEVLLINNCHSWC